MAQPKKVQGPKCWTGKCRLSYAAIFEPRAFKPGDKPRYSCDLIFYADDKEQMEGLIGLQAAANAVSLEAFQEPLSTSKKRTNVDSPFRAGSDKAGKDGYDNCFFFTPKTYVKPDVVLQDAETKADSSSVYAGCWVNVTLKPESYVSGRSKGIRFLLCNMQKLADGDAFGLVGTKASDDFKPAAVPFDQPDESTPFDGGTEDDQGLNI